MNFVSHPTASHRLRASRSRRSDFDMPGSARLDPEIPTTRRPFACSGAICGILPTPNFLPTMGDGIWCTGRAGVLNLIVRDKRGYGRTGQDEKKLPITRRTGRIEGKRITRIRRQALPCRTLPLPSCPLPSSSLDEDCVGCWCPPPPRAHC